MIERLTAALTDRYHIERELGAGGMATVYLADDLKHDRKVALKVLKPELAAVVGAERFVAEIRTTANLRHPHILPLFDSGEAAGFLYYVMPYVEGESLRDRLDREKQLPVDEAVSIATKVAGALQAAHEAGVIHRDIKPANILLEKGEPVVADFGIALAVSEGASGRLTETGLSMGTPYYMSPEQATGDQAPGPASDIFALACVLYEALVGEPPYPGSTAQAVLGKIIQGTPVSATEARAMVPPHVDAVIRRSLEKLPADRFARAADLSAALADPSFRHGRVEAEVAASASGRWKLVGLGATALAVIASGVAWSALNRPTASVFVERFETPLRADQLPNRYVAGRFSFSGDGTQFVYVGDGGVWQRRWDDPVARAIEGTQGASRLELSPDGTRLAYRKDTEIVVLPVNGGAPVTVGRGNWPQWGGNDALFYLFDGVLYRTTLDGTAPDTIRMPDGFRASDFALVPGAEAAVVWDGDALHAVDFATGEATQLLLGSQPVFASTGHLVYIDRDRRLSAIRFDPATLQVLGAPTAFADEVDVFALSESGKLFYALPPGGEGAEFVWVTRDGRITAVEDGWRFDRGAVNPGWSLSPDGTKLAYRDLNDRNNDIWIRELPDGPRTRLTTDAASDQSPRWSPDGTRIAFSSGRGNAGLNANLWAVAVEGTGVPELVHDHEHSIIDGSWVPNSDWMVLRTFPGGAPGRDIVALRPGIDSVALPILTEDWDERQPSPSPDGRWLAYNSDETGTTEIYVRPFPNVDDGKRPVSVDGGIMPVWSRDGRELFYVDREGRMIAASVSLGDDFQVTDRTVLFTLPDEILRNSSNILFSIDADDERFLMARLVRSDEPDQFGQHMLVNNFHELLKERLPN